MFCQPIQDLLGPRPGALGDDVTGVDEDIPRSGIVVGLAEEGLQVVEPTVDVSDEEDPGRLVDGWDVERGGLDVLAEVWLLQEVWEQGPRSDTRERDVEEESCEDGGGDHGAGGEAGRIATSIPHGRINKGSPAPSIRGRGDQWH